MLKLNLMAHLTVTIFVTKQKKTNEINDTGELLYHSQSRLYCSDTSP